jgi:hypothetical protein
VNVVGRGSWGMPGPLGLPMSSSRGFWLHHSVTRPTADPVADARVVANIGVQRFGRLSYSWLVHPDGTILQGQDGHVGAHTRGQNSTSEAICCIGNFETSIPTEEMCASVSLILAVRNKELLGGHRDAPNAATACPGKNLQSAVDGIRDNAGKWEGWGNKPAWVSDDAWRDLSSFARSGARFPAP